MSFRIALLNHLDKYKRFYKAIPFLKKYLDIDFILDEINRCDRIKEYQMDLFDGLYDCQFYPGADHPKIPQKIHPDNDQSLGMITRSCKSIIEQGRKPRYVNSINNNPKYNRNWCLIGSPTSNRLSDLFLTPFSQHNKYIFSDDFSMHKRYIDVNLRYSYNLIVDDNEKVRRYVEGHDNYEVKNWCIFDDDSEQNIVPIIGKNDFIKQDYLLITVMPNIFDKSKRNKVMIFGGCHGIGTKAVDLVLNDLDILSIIDKKREGNQYYQSLIKILEIEHKNNQSKPTIVKHKNTIPLEITIK